MNANTRQWGCGVCVGFLGGGKKGEGPRDIFDPTACFGPPPSMWREAWDMGEALRRLYEPALMIEERGRGH